jgi:hypothetical protein
MAMQGVRKGLKENLRTHVPYKSTSGGKTWKTVTLREPLEQKKTGPVNKKFSRFFGPAQSRQMNTRSIRERILTQRFPSATFNFSSGSQNHLGDVPDRFCEVLAQGGAPVRAIKYSGRVGKLLLRIADMLPIHCRFSNSFSMASIQSCRVRVSSAFFPCRVLMAGRVPLYSINRNRIRFVFQALKSGGLSIIR